MEVMRKAYGDRFENLSWDDIASYIRFELFANDVFVLGTRIMQQLLGVAIGGVLSSPFATIYCMAREHLWAKAHNFKFPWSHTSYSTIAWSPQKGVFGQKRASQALATACDRLRWWAPPRAPKKRSTFDHRMRNFALFNFVSRKIC